MALADVTSLPCVWLTLRLYRILRTCSQRDPCTKLRGCLGTTFEWPPLAAPQALTTSSIQLQKFKLPQLVLPLPSHLVILAVELSVLHTQMFNSPSIFNGSCLQSKSEHDSPTPNVDYPSVIHLCCPVRLLLGIHDFSHQS